VLEGSISATVFNFVGCRADYLLEVEIMGPTSTAELLSSSQVRIYPNPNRGQFAIEVDHPEVERGWSLELYSSSGALLQKRSFTSGGFQFNMESYRGAVKVVLRDDRGLVRFRDLVLIF